MATPTVLDPLLVLCRRYASTRSYKQPTKEVLHPYVNEPQRLSLKPRNATAVTIGSQIYFPKNYYTDLMIESSRSGDFLGSDFPFGFSSKQNVWRTRKYNILNNSVPNVVSKEKSVNYYHRLQVWSTHWYENKIHRMRRFKCAYGFNRAKTAAEILKKNLLLTGRIDNLKTEEQRRLDLNKIRSIKSLKGSYQRK
ncbi:AP2 domain family protein [Babesia bovis T2Bo]|uniref:Uncharacterized protein n=1 Tax=Babesia bovis TaxID=5865 RepID=A7AX32_BABBO|nr:AP2 domain family protein [Babesia bovis T2Bo]EDO05105.1 AP2 domain family protein [Babesia bovis T2Bo]|eukprot:XP_001608673.1 hypothetical protein [Babesia bovis T2Bo]